MRVHHLNCGCMCPFGGSLWDGASRGISAHLTCHCVLVESDRGLILVDTGFGLGDMAEPVPRLSALFLTMNRIQLDPDLTARRQIEALGFQARDVRHIVLTHLDFDHAGGLDDFPDATVHVMGDELDAAERRDGFIGRRRYRPDQWAGVRRWRRYREQGERWFGFEAVRDLDGLPPDILLVPLRGHSEGHAGVAIRTDEGWLLNAGDAYFYRHEVDRPRRYCPPAARAYQNLMAVDRDARDHNQARLRRLAQGNPELRMFCSHDPIEFEALSQASR